MPAKSPFNSLHIFGYLDPQTTLRTGCSNLWADIPVSRLVRGSIYLNIRLYDSSSAASQGHFAHFGLLASRTGPIFLRPFLGAVQTRLLLQILGTCSKGGDFRKTSTWDQFFLQSKIFSRCTHNADPLISRSAPVFRKSLAGWVSISTAGKAVCQTLNAMGFHSRPRERLFAGRLRRPGGLGLERVTSG